MSETSKPDSTELRPPDALKKASQEPSDGVPKEIGGPEGPEPTRFGDWERKGRCVDFWCDGQNPIWVWIVLMYGWSA